MAWLEGRLRLSTTYGSYVELHARSAFNFLRGASFPEQMAEVAAGSACRAWPCMIAMACTARRVSIEEARNRESSRSLAASSRWKMAGFCRCWWSPVGLPESLSPAYAFAVAWDKGGIMRVVEELEEFGEGLLLLTDGGLREGGERFSARCDLAGNRIERLERIFGSEIMRGDSAASRFVVRDA